MRCCWKVETMRTAISFSLLELQSLFLVSSLFLIRNCCQTRSLAAQIFQQNWVLNISKANRTLTNNIHIFFLVDHDRPLSKAGQDDAIKVSQRLQQLGWIPQLILSRFN